jgi:ketosteroid isomerase-like protein
MIERIAILALLLANPLKLHAADTDAKALAQSILDKGAALFDTQDATAIAATYTEDAQILWFDKDSSTGELKLSFKKDRSEIEQFYRDLFKDAKEKTISKNTIEYARLLAPDLLVIHGFFQPNASNNGKYPFVQVRVKSADKWLLKTLQFFVVPLD